MTREIKFRGKRLDNGEWVFGDLLTKYPHHKGLTIVENGVIHHEVDPKTVGQYTGLKDKHGKEICEGDVLRCVDNCGEEYATKVWFDGGALCIEVYNSDYDVTSIGWALYKDIEECVIIGNIHDNPELLEV